MSEEVKGVMYSFHCKKCNHLNYISIEELQLVQKYNLQQLCNECSSNKAKDDLVRCLDEMFLVDLDGWQE